jgi:anthranilate phosphoribosyltransferase
MLDLMRQIMTGSLTPVMSAAILTGLRVKKEAIGEITAATIMAIAAYLPNPARRMPLRHWA